MEGANQSREAVSFEVAFTRLGIGRTKAYQMVREGTFPVRTYQVGRHIKVSKYVLDRFLEKESPLQQD